MTEFTYLLTAAFALAALVGWWFAFRAQRKASMLEGQATGLLQEIDRISTDIEEYKLRDEARLSTEKHASALEQQIKHFQEREAQRAQELNVMQTQFENLANKIFEEKQKAFSERSQKGLETLLAPMKERLGEFHKKVDETYGQHAKEQHFLKQEIGRIVEVNQAMKLQTESLTKALKGDVKTQGVWGEVILEKVLEASGLRKGENYTLQGEGMGLKHVDTGGHLKPDVIINLPEDKHLIVDSKVSLTHYERYCSEEDEQARAVHLKQFVGSVRSHINGLESKRYQDSEKLGTPDFVVLFMPIEAAYVLAMQADPELQSYAWDKRIFITTPSTLFPILRTVHSIWRMDLQNKNAMDIAKKGGDLYDKVALFVDDMQKLGMQMKTATGTYDKAMNKLSEGNGNIVRRTEQLKALGAKTSKQLPAQLLEVGAEADEREQESA